MGKGLATLNTILTDIVRKNEKITQLDRRMIAVRMITVINCEMFAFGASLECAKCALPSLGISVKISYIRDISSNKEPRVD